MSSKIFGCICLALYVMLLVPSFVWVKVSITPTDKPQSDIIYIEYAKPEPPEQPKPKPKPKPTQKVKEAPKHEKLAPKDNTQQTQGKAEKTRTVNQKALFQQSKGGVDKPADIGNEKAEQDTVLTASGIGQGLNPFGTIELDEGLQGRGIVGEMPVPDNTHISRSGKIVVDVVVDNTGTVTSAKFQPKGSTVQDKAMVEAALSAARKARFAEGKAFDIGGRITYIFKLQ